MPECNHQLVLIFIWLDWMIDNLNIEEKRKMKAEQLWIVSRESGRGKTTLLQMLALMLRVYWITKTENDDEWEDGRYDLAIIDEYRDGWKPIEWMNKFAEGGTMTLKRKFRTDYIKQQNVPLIICSNQTIFECYNHLPHHDIHLIEVRFLEVDVEENDIRIEWDTVSFDDL